MTDASESTVPKIYSALASVQAGLTQSGVGKGGLNKEQRFRFRAWDDVQQALAGQLAKHHVLGPHPVIGERIDQERKTAKGTIMSRVILKGMVRFVSADDGSVIEYDAIGEAMDAGDKATSKAQTMMIKYAIVHGLCVPLEGIADNDEATPETVKSDEPVSREQLGEIMTLKDEANADTAKLCEYYGVDSLAQIPASRFEQVKALLEKKIERQNNG